jgi:tetratricopeptide (TPR) repeat protein
LLPAFANIGYAAYRLVPGLQILVPFETEGDIEPFQLNLFFCKPHQAKLLEERGFLAAGQSSDVSALNVSGWRDFLGEFSYAKRLAEGWARSRDKDISPDARDYEAVLAFYELSRRENRHPGTRYAALRQALEKLVTLIQADPSPSRLMSLSRIYADMGLRSKALDVLEQLRGMDDDLLLTCSAEPFLAVSARFDSIDPGDDFTNWIISAILDQWELLSHYSSYFSGVASLENLETLQQLGFCKQDIERRIELVRLRDISQGSSELKV